MVVTEYLTIDRKYVCVVVSAAILSPRVYLCCQPALANPARSGIDWSYGATGNHDGCDGVHIDRNHLIYWSCSFLPVPRSATATAAPLSSIPANLWSPSIPLYTYTISIQKPTDLLPPFPPPQLLLHLLAPKIVIGGVFDFGDRQPPSTLDQGNERIDGNDLVDD